MCVGVIMRVCVCVCDWGGGGGGGGRQTNRKRHRETETQRERQRNDICFCSTARSVISRLVMNLIRKIQQQLDSSKNLIQQAQKQKILNDDSVSASSKDFA